MGCKGNLPNVNGHFKKDQALLWYSEHSDIPVISFSTSQQNKDGVKRSYSDNQEWKPLFMQVLYKSYSNRNNIWHMLWRITTEVVTP